MIVDAASLSGRIAWLVDVETAADGQNGLVQVQGYDPSLRPAHEVAIMEKASDYGAHAVLFEASADGSNGAAQAFVFTSNMGDGDDFALLHQRLWTWGGVPLVYRRLPGVVQLFRCAHGPDFLKDGRRVYNPYDMLKIGAQISELEAWWDSDRIRNGTLWDDPETAAKLLSKDDAAHARLVTAVKNLHKKLDASGVLSPHLRRRLLILSLLIAYLDQRGALPDQFFARCKEGAQDLPAVLADGEALHKMLAELEILFNGDVFSLEADDLSEIKTTTELEHFSRLIEAREEASGQMNLWELYAFGDLPVEVISHIYEIFVSDESVSVYTPPALVRLILDETLNDARLDRIIDHGEVLLDPSCGSGIFLVEAFKRIVLRWRSRNAWKTPDVNTLRVLLGRVHGVDLEAGAIELATFGLCLAMCDALPPQVIRSTPRLFPKLRDHGLFHSCFFLALETGLLSRHVGVVVGNPPFKSKLDTPGAQRAYEAYLGEHGKLPDLQVAYLFLHEAMKLLLQGGVIGMLQQYNLLYNEKPDFRRAFLSRWNVREILDFVSVRGLFSKDTKVLTVVAIAEPPELDGSLLHAVFRRSPMAEANHRFDVDYYDLHRIPQLAIRQDDTPDIWRSNLLGGARAYAFVKRLRGMPTLEEHAKARGWDYGEGFIEGKKGKKGKADHLYGQPLLPSDALTTVGVQVDRITRVEHKPIEGPRTAARFSPPMLLVREHADLPHVLWRDTYLTYKNKIVGFAAKSARELKPVETWLQSEIIGLRAYAAMISVRMCHQKATTLSCRDIYDLPFDPAAKSLDMSPNERMVADDVVNHYIDYVRVGSASPLAKDDGRAALDAYAEIFAAQISAFYPRKPLNFAGTADFDGTICQGFVFGDGEIDWTGTDELKGRLDALLKEHRGTSLSMTRIARIYDGQAIFLLKPSRLRYWLPSTALRDSDDTLADLRSQGF